MNIRNAISEDKVNVLEFCKGTFSWGDYIADVWDGWQSKGRLYVVEVGNKVVGVYNLAIFEKHAWIEGMRVHPQYRRRGLGKSMLSHADSIIQNKIIRLIIESRNQPSIALARSMGYYLEEKWQLYSILAKKQSSNVKIANDISQIKNLINSVTYAHSWKWFPLDDDELQKLIYQERVVISNNKDVVSAVGIWNRYDDFPKILQIGYLNGTKDGITQILKYIQNKAYDLNCRKIQIFTHEKTSLDTAPLDKRLLFYLMRKDKDQ